MISFLHLPKKEGKNLSAVPTKGRQQMKEEGLEEDEKEEEGVTYPGSQGVDMD